MKVTLLVPPSPLTGTVRIEAICSPQSSVTRVEFYIDSVLKSPTDTSPPFTYDWNTTTVGDAQHNISVKVFYGRNKMATAQVTRETSNAVTPSPTPTTQAPPVNTTPPAISGTATEGQMLTVSEGLWTNNPESFQRQWLRCDAAGANPVLIASATNASYVLTATDVGKTIRCAVTAWNFYGASLIVETAQTAVVSALAPAVPVNVSVPVISGTPVRGNSLSSSNGSWTNNPTSYTYAWLRCDYAAAVIAGDASLVSLWPFSEASGVFDDAKGANNSVSVGAGVTYNQAIQQTDGKAARFNGSSGWINIADAADLDITGALTIEAWIRPDGLGVAGYQAIFAKYTGASGGDYELYVISTGANVGRLEFYVRGGGVTSSLQTASGGLTQGQVYHVVATYQDSSDTMKIYINGVEAVTTSSATAVLAASSSSINIGGRRAGVGVADHFFFNGLIDEVALYNSALSAARVLAHYDAGRVGGTGGTASTISGATAQTYTLVDADTGKMIRSKVTAINGTGSSTPVESNTSAAVTQSAVQPPPPPPEGYYLNGNFDTCNLSQWIDFHDAQLSQSPPGFVTVTSPRYGGSGCAAKVTVMNTPSTSSTGDGSMLWEGSGSNSYSLPYLQNGQSTWFRMQVAFPNGADSNFPGTFTVAPMGGWDTIQSWHADNGAVPGAYSTVVGVHPSWGYPGSPGVLLFRPVGGTDQYAQTFTYLYQTNGAAQTAANGIPIQFNHWYDILVHLVFGTTAATGRAEWWIDGIQQTSANVPTITSPFPGGSVPGVGHEVGLYRGPSQTYADTIYIDGVLVGPTRTSVGG